MIEFNFSHTAVYHDSRADIQLYFWLRELAYCHQFQCEIVIPDSFIYLGNPVCPIQPRSLRKDRMESHPLKLVGQQTGTFDFKIQKICYKRMNNKWSYQEDSFLQLVVVSQSEPPQKSEPSQATSLRISCYKKLKSSFSRDELIELCFLLGANHENFSKRHDRLVQDMINYFDNRGRLGELDALMREKRS